MMVAPTDVKLCWALVNNADHAPETNWRKMLEGKEFTMAANRLSDKLVFKTIPF